MRVGVADIVDAVEDEEECIAGGPGRGGRGDSVGGEELVEDLFGDRGYGGEIGGNDRGINGGAAVGEIVG